jgi:activator of HSP90 ATPase
MSTTIHQEIIFKASPNRVYEALTNADHFSKLAGGSPTEISSEVGGSFSCFGGMIVGRNIELVPNKRIVQAWRVANWEDGVYSIVRYEFKEQGSETLLVFDHTGIIEGQSEHLESGWNDNYWKNIEKYLA